MLMHLASNIGRVVHFNQSLCCNFLQNLCDFDLFISCVGGQRVSFSVLHSWSLVNRCELRPVLWITVGFHSGRSEYGVCSIRLEPLKLLSPLTGPQILFLFNLWRLWERELLDIWGEMKIDISMKYTSFKQYHTRGSALD